MIKKVTYKDCPELFEDITEFSVHSEQNHRRGSNFFRTDIIEFKADDKEYFQEVENFEDYIGFWKTNEVIWDSEYGFDNTFSELTRVEKRVKIVEEIIWEGV